MLKLSEFVVVADLTQLDVCKLGTSMFIESRDQRLCG